MAVYAYLRLSTSEDRQKNSFMVQMDAIKVKFPQVDEIVRETVSGSAHIEKRPKLLELLGRLKRGDIVAVYRLDRLARDMVKSGWIRLEIQKRGATLESVNDPTKRDPTGKLIDNILLTVAEHEKDMIRSRITSTLALKKRRGEKLGGFTPYGWECREQEGRKLLVKNPKEQQHILMMLKLYKRKGWGIYRIQVWCRESGIKAKGGGEMSYAAVKKIIERAEREGVGA